MNINDKFFRLATSFKKLHYILENEFENNWSKTIGIISHEMEVFPIIAYGGMTQRRELK